MTGPVPVEGSWDGRARRQASRLPAVLVPRSELDGGGVAVPLRPMPRWAGPLLVVLGVALVGLFGAALVTTLRGGGAAGAPFGLVVLGLFALLGVAFLAAVPSVVRASRGGRRWLLTPEGVTTTSVTVPWDAIAAVHRQTLTYPSRLRTRNQHLLAVGLRDEVDPGDLPGLAESHLASALLAHSRRKVVALGDVGYLGVDPEPLVRAIALLAARPDLREGMGDNRGVRLVETGSPG